MNRHRALTAWKRGHDLALAIHRAVDQLPHEHRFEMGRQLRRAATSVPSNIAEGCARRGAGEFAHFLSISLGSLAEIDSLLALIRDLGYLDTMTLRGLEEMRERASIAVFTLSRRIRGSR
jgi:four helix bundle protein